MAPNGTGIDKPSEWRGGGDAGWRVEMFAKDEQIRVLTARLAAAEAFVAKHKCGKCGGVRVTEQELCKCTENEMTDAQVKYRG